MLGSVVNMDSPEKKPISSRTVKNRVKLRATRYLHGIKTKVPLLFTILQSYSLIVIVLNHCWADMISITSYIIRIKI